MVDAAREGSRGPPRRPGKGSWNLCSDLPFLHPVSSLGSWLLAIWTCLGLLTSEEPQRVFLPPARKEVTRISGSRIARG